MTPTLKNLVFEESSTVSPGKISYRVNFRGPCPKGLLVGPWCPNPTEALHEWMSACDIALVPTTPTGLENCKLETGTSRCLVDGDTISLTLLPTDYELIQAAHCCHNILRHFLPIDLEARFRVMNFIRYSYLNVPPYV